MRLIPALSLAILLASSNAAMAQDVVVTQLLQRVCFPFMQSTSDSPISVVDAAARSLNLRLTDQRERREGSVLIAIHREYSLNQANGAYTVRAIDSRTSPRSCSLTAPGTVSVPHLQQAVTNATGDDWAVEFTDDGPAWKRVAEHGYSATIVTAGLSFSGIPAVWVNTEEYDDEGY